MEQHSRRLTKSETAEMVPKHPRNETKSRAHHFEAVHSKFHMRMAPALCVNLLVYREQERPHSLAN